MPISMPTPEEQERLQAHWRKVRAGLHVPDKAPAWETRSAAVKHHQFQARQHMARSIWHTAQAVEAAKGDIDG